MNKPNMRLIPESENPELYAKLYMDKGLDFHEAMDTPKALECLTKAIEIAPNYALSYFNRGIIFETLCQSQLMEQDFKKALALDPNNYVILRNIAACYITAERFIDAIELLQKAIQVEPNCAQSWMNLADSYYHAGNYDVAKTIFDKALERFPDSPIVKLKAAFCIPQIPMSDAEIDEVRAKMFADMDRLEKEGLRIEKLEECLPHTLFYSHYHGRDNRALNERLAKFFRTIAPSICYTAPHCKQPRKARGEKLKIGFITPTMHKKTLNQFMLGVIEQLDQRDDMEITVFSNAPYNHPLTVANRSRIKRYVPLEKTLKGSQELIAKEELDVIFQLELGAYPLVTTIAHARLAHVQCSWGGIPITSGIPEVDYFFAVKGMEPENCRQYYTEKPVLFDRILADFKKPAVYRPFKTKEDLGFPAGDFRYYTCPVMLFKLHPDMDWVFGEILRRDPKAIILLFDPRSNVRQISLRKRFAKNISEEDMKRVIFIPFKQEEEFMHFLRAVDCVMDTFHFSFGTTSFLCFGVEAPFVTWPGKTQAGRAGYFLYNKMGIPDLIADSREKFVELCLKLAQDKEFYNTISTRIEQENHSIFNDAQSAKDLGDMFLKLYHGDDAPIPEQ